MDRKEAEERVHVRLPRELADAFGRYCAAQDQTRSQVVRRLIRELLEKERQPRLKL